MKSPELNRKTYQNKLVQSIIQKLEFNRFYGKETICSLTFAWFLSFLIFSTQTKDIGYAFESSIIFIPGPIVGLAFVTGAKFITPGLILFFGITQLIKIKIVRRILLLFLSMLWMAFGFVCLAVSY